MQKLYDGLTLQQSLSIKDLQPSWIESMMQGGPNPVNAQSSALLQRFHGINKSLDMSKQSYFGYKGGSSPNFKQKRRLGEPVAVKSLQTNIHDTSLKFELF